LFDFGAIPMTGYRGQAVTFHKDEWLNVMAIEKA
jgi:hypothetical protein